MKRIRALAKGSCASRRVRFNKWVKAHQREAAKLFYFGMNYGMPARRLQENVNTDPLTSAELVGNFNKNFPAFAEFRRRIEHEPG